MDYLIRKFAHELRNPLTSIYSTLQFIEMQHPEVQDFKFWSALSGDIAYMNALITDFSNYSKLDQLNQTTISSKAMLEQVTLSFAASIADSAVEYRSKLAPDLPQITGDETKLKEVFRNLLRNAYEASLPNKTIFLEAFTENDLLIVRIQDTGCGISEEDLPTIFEPFVTYKRDGTGLGLAICKQIVTAHHGKIEVTSALRKGTTFVVSLPLAEVSFEEQSEE